MLGKRPHRHIISDFGKIHNHNLPRHIVVGFELVTSSSSSSGESTHDHAITKKKTFFTASPYPCRNNISPRSVLRPPHDHNPNDHGPHGDFHAKKREEAYADPRVLDTYNLRAGLLAEQIYNTINVEEGFIDDDDDDNSCGGDHGSISSPSYHHNHHGIKHNVGNIIVHTWPMMGIEHVNVPDVIVNEDRSPRIPLANMKFGHISSASTCDGDTSVHTWPTTKLDDKPIDSDDSARISMGSATRNFDGIHEDMRPAHTWPGTIFQAASPPNHRSLETPFSSWTMFLEQCFLCRSSLQGKDIYMYRGDKAFCSMECRHKQIVIDERE